MTSFFDASSHLKTIPSRLDDKMHLVHWHPVVIGSVGGTIISTFSFLWTTPITLTVLPSLIYLHSQECNLDVQAHWQLLYKNLFLHTKMHTHCIWTHCSCEHHIKLTFKVVRTNNLKKLYFLKYNMLNNIYQLYISILSKHIYL